MAMIGIAGHSVGSRDKEGKNVGRSGGMHLGKPKAKHCVQHSIWWCFLCVAHFYCSSLQSCPGY
jgi:hypothetical protein